jgi:hypothetical protein
MEAQAGAALNRFVSLERFQNYCSRGLGPRSLPEDVSKRTGVTDPGYTTVQYALERRREAAGSERVPHKSKTPRLLAVGVCSKTNLLRVQ